MQSSVLNEAEILKDSTEHLLRLEEEVLSMLYILCHSR